MVCGTWDPAPRWAAAGARNRHDVALSRIEPAWCHIVPVRSDPAAGGGGGHQGVTPERLRPTTPARTRAIDTSFMVDTVSPRKAMPITAVPAAPIPVQTA